MSNPLSPHFLSFSVCAQRGICNDQGNFCIYGNKHGFPHGGLQGKLSCFDGVEPHHDSMGIFLGLSGASTPSVLPKMI